MPKPSQGQVATSQFLCMLREAYEKSETTFTERLACGICGEITPHQVEMKGSKKMMTCKKCGIYRQRTV